ncbi:MAG: methyltransferase family protein [Caulobacteraceae bacterium]
MSATTAVIGLWIVWYATWIAAVIFSGKTSVQMGRDIVGPHRALASIGVVLLFVPTQWPLAAPLWPEPGPTSWILLALVVVGFGFCWWARLHLGRLWSGFVTLKEDHRIVDTGPYALVRHPIYSGVMFAALMTALIRATPAALVGFALVCLGFAMTARIEERFLRAQLGSETYDAYSRRVPMLVPRLG